MEAIQQSTDRIAASRRSIEPDSLSTHIKKAVDHYFSQLNGHGASGLYAMVINEVEKPLIEAVLAHSGHNQTKAAKVLGLSRSTLRKKMDHHHIN